MCPDIGQLFRVIKGNLMNEIPCHQPAHHLVPSRLFERLESELAPRRDQEQDRISSQVDSAPTTSSDFNGLLGVIRQDSIALERRRLYDFWVKPS